MKLIHCADLHLDSKMTTNFDKEKARERKNELLYSYQRMINYACANQVEGILIAGDLFDTKNISATARNVVLSSMISHPELSFFYLKGNHDQDNFLADADSLPDNLFVFGSSWCSYTLDKVKIYGLELTKDNVPAAWHELILDSHDFNIVMLHGQESDASSGDRTEIIPIKELRNRGIDYLALGHVHSYKLEALDARGQYCYPGCLEGRGYDECGEHGFVLLTIDEEGKRYETEFIPFSGRSIHEIAVDISSCMTSAEIVGKTEKKLQGSSCRAEDLVKIVLCGEVDLECEKDITYISSCFRDRYYDVRISDQTHFRLDAERYLLDESLKGEFVRLVMGDAELSDSDKTSIIRCGIQAIAGEEIC